MRPAVRKIDGYLGETDIAVNAWLAEADRLIWSDCAQAQRVAGAIVSDIAAGRLGNTLASRRSYLASAEGEIAKARELASFIINPEKKRNARKAIAKMARAVRTERGV